MKQLLTKLKGVALVAFTCVLASYAKAEDVTVSVDFSKITSSQSSSVSGGSTATQNGFTFKGTGGSTLTESGFYNGTANSSSTGGYVSYTPEYGGGTLSCTAANGNTMAGFIGITTNLVAASTSAKSKFQATADLAKNGGTGTATLGECVAGTTYYFEAPKKTTITAISYTYAKVEVESVATPTIQPAAGCYDMPMTEPVTLGCATEGATIYYTTDGSQPTTSSTVYSSPFYLSDGCIVKVLAVKSSARSLVASAKYTKETTATISDVTARQRYPWNGKVDISYVTTNAIVAAAAHGFNAQLMVIAIDRSTSPWTTNVADMAHLSVGPRGTEALTHAAALANGAHEIVWDMNAQGLTFKSANVTFAISCEGKIPCGQLWEDGPCWSACNVGAQTPEAYGYYFWWGDTVGYTNNVTVVSSESFYPCSWMAVDGSSTDFAFDSDNPKIETYGLSEAELKTAGYIDDSGNLVIGTDASTNRDAARAHLGAPWRMPSCSEFSNLVEKCSWQWVENWNDTGVNGTLISGKGDYALSSIFLPANGNGCVYGSLPYLESVGAAFTLWSSSLSEVANKSFFAIGSASGASLQLDLQFYGNSVRPVCDITPKSPETFAAKESSAVTVDLSTGTRIAAATETLTYSTAWDGGETATIKVNGTQQYQASGNGAYDWTTSGVGGLYTVTHTVETNSVPVVLTANFIVPVQVGDNALALITNGVCEIVGTGATWAKDDWSDGNPLKAYDAAITNLVVEDGITGLGANLFENMWYVQNVTLGADCVSVGDRAFKKCYGLTNVTSKATGTSSVGECAFSGCHSLQGLSFAGAASFDDQAYTLQAAIYMKDGGIPVVYAMPTITVAGKSEHIMGKKTLADAWTDVTDASDEVKKNYHFFKIEVR